MFSAITGEYFFRKLRLLLLGFICMNFAGCCLLFSPEIEQEGQNRPDNGGGAPTAPSGSGYAGKAGSQPAEAEQLYARAGKLWRKSAGGEVCSNPEEAVALLDKAVAIAPKYGEAYVRRGLAKSELGEFEEAFEDATQGVRLSPGAQAYAFRGLVLLRGGQKKAARKDLEYSLKKSPGQSLAYNFLGVLALSEDSTAEACKSFQEGCSRGDCFFLETARREKICP